MPVSDPKVDVADRRGSWVGGSEWRSVLSLPPYGCRRQLWYEKTGQTPDYPQEVSGAMQRGTEMEDLVAELYSRETGRSLQKRTQYASHGPEWLRGHPDRLIVANGDGRGSGILEVKTAGEWMFKKFKREGLPDYYILQLQHYLALSGFSWGAWAILWADGWKFETFEVEADKELMENLLERGEMFVREVENGPTPHRLDPPDKRCTSCSFRTTCQGEVLLEAAGGDREDLEVLGEEAELQRLLAEYRELKDIADETDERLDGVKTGIKGRLKDLGHDAVQLPGSRIYHRSSIRNSLDSKRLKADHPKLAEKYMKQTAVRSLRIFSI